MTIDQHKQLGDRLHQLRRELREIGEILESHFQVPVWARWSRAADRLLDIRSPLENELIRLQVDMGIDDGNPPRVYYRGEQ
jgi:hypothetical protein